MMATRMTSASDGPAAEDPAPMSDAESEGGGPRSAAGGVTGPHVAEVDDDPTDTTEAGGKLVRGPRTGFRKDYASIRDTMRARRRSPSLTEGKLLGIDADKQLALSAAEPEMGRAAKEGAERERAVAAAMGEPTSSAMLTGPRVRGPSVAIVKVDLSDTLLGDSALGLIAGACPQLTALTLRRCRRIGASGLGSIFRRCHRLTSLDVTDSQQLNDAAISALVAACTPTDLRQGRATFLAAAASLRSTSEVDWMQSQGFACPLSALTLTGCHRITDDGVAALARRFGASLQALHLSGCRAVGDASLSALAEHCFGLQELSLAGRLNVQLPAVKPPGNAVAGTDATSHAMLIRRTVDDDGNDIASDDDGDQGDLAGGDDAEAWSSGDEATQRALAALDDGDDVVAAAAAATAGGADRRGLARLRGGPKQHHKTMFGRPRVTGAGLRRLFESVALRASLQRLDLRGLVQLKDADVALMFPLEAERERERRLDRAKRRRRRRRKQKRRMRWLQQHSREHQPQQQEPGTGDSFDTDRSGDEADGDGKRDGARRQRQGALPGRRGTSKALSRRTGAQARHRASARATSKGLGASSAGDAAGSAPAAVAAAGAASAWPGADAARVPGDGSSGSDGSGDSDSSSGVSDNTLQERPDRVAPGYFDNPSDRRILRGGGGGLDGISTDIFGRATSDFVVGDADGTIDGAGTYGGIDAEVASLAGSSDAERRREEELNIAYASPAGLQSLNLRGTRVGRAAVQRLTSWLVEQRQLTRRAAASAGLLPDGLAADGGPDSGWEGWGDQAHTLAPAGPLSSAFGDGDASGEPALPAAAAVAGALPTSSASANPRTGLPRDGPTAGVRGAAPRLRIGRRRTAVAAVEVPPFTPALRRLLLSNCADLDDAALAEFGRAAPYLESLTIDGSVLVTTAGVAAVAAVCPNLRLLSLCRVSLVTDDAVAALARDCPLMERLRVKDCPDITQGGLLRAARLLPRVWLGLESSLQLGQSHVGQVSVTDQSEGQEASGTAQLAIPAPASGNRRSDHLAAVKSGRSVAPEQSLLAVTASIEPSVATGRSAGDAADATGGRRAVAVKAFPGHFPEYPRDTATPSVLWSARTAGAKGGLSSRSSGAGRDTSRSFATPPTLAALRGADGEGRSVAVDAVLALPRAWDEPGSGRSDAEVATLHGA
ncbi:hypothetical protein FNF31_04100 [Cafeteria roenbergensis]|uniref:F-box domain-containing protein n=2 Tax=Cafeteria roenbergensis TaxID=33653 RepID=A0A5A8D5Q7_CAFRO|nr:hypothetical protein FNF31_04100 [Cafeteria roenbergensis]